MAKAKPKQKPAIEASQLLEAPKEIQSPASKPSRTAKSATVAGTVIVDPRKNITAIIAGLAKTYPVAECALHHSSTFQLLVATILSAQCTDERVNMVTPVLFGKYPTAAELALADQADVEEIVHSLGFFRAKAANIRTMAQELVYRYQGEVPRELSQLIELPGIGRKTANVVLGTSFGIASGVVVDTHVKRLTRLLGLTESTNPEQIEREMMELMPSSEWVNFSHRLIHHGRRICIARRPRCEECPLVSLCARTGLPALDLN